MKKVDNVNERAKHPNPKSTQEQKDSMNTFRDLVSAFCINVPPKNLQDARAYNAAYEGLLDDEKLDLLLENNEHEILYKRLQDNPTGLPNHLYLFVCNKLGSAKAVEATDTKEKTEDKPNG